MLVPALVGVACFLFAKGYTLLAVATVAVILFITLVLSPADKAKKRAVQTQKSSDENVRKVREVLPDTPVGVIREELEKAESVEKAIASLIEKKTNPAKASDSTTKNKPLSHLSFAERKAKMYADARKQYLAKHPEYKPLKQPVD